VHDVNVNEAIKLREENLPEKAVTVLQRLITELPNDPIINFQLAWTYDFMGKEREAIPYYERAIANGLAGEDLKGAMLGLGSTLRCLGEYEKSSQVLTEAVREFPEDRFLKVFLALTQYNLRNHEEAFREILMQLLDTTTDDSIRSYDRALRFYADRLDDTWA
jgi:tetratricopeptide (TPR) repeat protein